MKNRYDSKLRENNKKILELCSEVMILRKILALEIKKETVKNPDLKIIELGCGEGDSTISIMKENPNLKMDVLDISSEMIEIAKVELKNYSKSLNFICDDALNYLDKNNWEYNIITTSWTIHNFVWNEKKAFLKRIYNRLVPGGKFMIMDKVYPDNKIIQKQMLDHQNKRYKYLEKDLSEEIINHESQDYSDEYKMEETQFTNELSKIGFKNIKIIDRVERDLVLIAEK